MADLLQLSSDIIDNGLDPVRHGPVNRITHELSELGDGLALIESFSHVVTLRTAAGLLLFDTSGKFTGGEVVKSLRRYSDAAVHTVVYTHGHVDHVGGASALVADGEARGHARPRFVGHQNVAARMARYELTNGYNLHVNKRQFGGGPEMLQGAFLPVGTPRPDVTVSDQLQLDVGDETLELHHARGETDDHLWTYLPSRKLICAGDFLIWSFPNAGNPQKVQRYPLEWAAALRQMAGTGAELFIPAHGLPIGGEARIARVLLDVAGALEQLVERTLELMNAGATLDTILHEVKAEAPSLSRPHLLPLYDEPEFVVRNVYRLYGGWYDGNPAHLKPPREQQRAHELVALIGGVGPLVERARALCDGGELRLACDLIETALHAAPDDRAVHEARFEIYRARRAAEMSLMAKGIFGAAATESWNALHPGEPPPFTREKGYGI